MQRPSQAPALGVADVAKPLRHDRPLDRALQDVSDRPQEVDLVGVEMPLLTCEGPDRTERRPAHDGSDRGARHAVRDEDL